MAARQDEEMAPLTKHDEDSKYADHRASIDSSAASDVSLTLALLDSAGRARSSTPSGAAAKKSRQAGKNVKFMTEGQYRDEERDVLDHEKGSEDEDDDDDEIEYLPPGGKPADRRVRIVFWVLVLLCIGGWSVAFFVFLFSPRGSGAQTKSGHNIAPAVDKPSQPSGFNSVGRRITLEEWIGGQWSQKTRDVSWIAGPNGEDGMLLEQQEGSATAYLRVEDIRSRQKEATASEPIVLMNRSTFEVKGDIVFPSKKWPSPNLKSVLVASDEEQNWRHSFTAKYWLFDVGSQKGQHLDPQAPHSRIQLATWSPTSDAVVFTRDNNMFIRDLASKSVKNITTDGGADLFYGIPDWVYEEEVFGGNSATWWSDDGQHIAFLRTDETAVPEFPVQYFLSRPSGKVPSEGQENYPDVVNIKYPKAGAPNPTVHIWFYDVAKGETFTVNIADDFPDDDRLIIEVVWGSRGQVLVRETNRESDILKVVLIDTKARTGRIVRSVNVKELDGGWVEVSQKTRFIPADPDNGRLHDGYVDTVIHDGYNHLGYFTPLDSSEPIHLTSGPWEVVNSPSAVDLRRGLVYFQAAKQAPGERHFYSVKLDGSELQPITNISEPGYYGLKFSTGAGYGLLHYQGPAVPWQRLISVPANQEASYDELLEENLRLKKMTRTHAMPLLVYSNVTIDGFTLPVVEMRPPNFDPKKKYPVLFHLYGGPGSQTVSRQFSVGFQTYVASSLEYLVVTVDGRGTGFIGRRARCIIRDNLGHYEARDQIETAKIWGRKPYVDKTRMAIWGWSYGGYMTLKTLEQDAGRTFQYGMAVAPVTDWQFYDSIYTERYMHTPQHNPDGYAQSAISNMTALSQTTRFLMMHGASDDNVHFQNSLNLLDSLDVANVDNYDSHVFPDSNHGIYFHNAYIMVHTRLSDWLINAFNGEWSKIRNPVPNPSLFRRGLGKAGKLLNRLRFI